MDRNELMVLIAGCLTTLLDCDGMLCPESSFYLVCDSNMDKWQTVRAFLLNGKWVTISNHCLSLTDLGRTTAAKIAAALPKE